MIKAILYDLDGTLLDCIEDLGDSLNLFLERLGQEPTTIEQFRALLEIGSRELLLDSIHRIPEGMEPSTLYDMYNEEYSKRLWVKTKPFEGVYDMLEAINQRGIRQAVISNKPHSLVEPICDYFFDGIFERCLGTIPLPPKPDPTMIQQVMEDLLVKPDEVLYLGDTLGDMKAAKNAGVCGSWVDWGYGGKHVFDRMLHHPLELLDVLEELA